jgi:transmembrane sensor
MMEEAAPHDLEDQAIAWVVRVGDPAFDDWDDFARWLAESPAHADAYHAVAAAEADMVAQLVSEPVAPAPMVETAPVRARPRRLQWAGAAIAASLVAFVAFRVQEPAAPHIYETAPGIQRTVNLADGSKVILNGGTKLVVDADDTRLATLERGEGLFVIHHDANHPFRVATGGATLTDIGTAFNVVREAKTTRVAVAEGAVQWARAGGTVRLDAGRRLNARDDSPTVELGPVAKDAVGGWSRGQLTFDGVPLSVAVADLSRSLGVTVSVAPAIANRPVRGVIRLDGGTDAVMPRFAALMELRTSREKRGWRLLGPS